MILLKMLLIPQGKIGGCMSIQISVKDARGEVRAERSDEKYVSLAFYGQDEPGDYIEVKVTEVPAYYYVQLDDAKDRALVYVTGDFTYEIPFELKRVHISPKVFSGDRHLLVVKKAEDFQHQGYRDLAFNSWDSHENTTVFPHASANVETRGEMVFAALNAIDGTVASYCHGDWPYETWGINRDPQAEFRLDFGRKVKIDRLLVYLRADFPHDSHWTRGTFRFSDGSQLVCDFEKTPDAQEFTFQEKEVEWLTFSDLIKAEDESPFPALAALEVYGYDQ